MQHICYGLLTFEVDFALVGNNSSVERVFSL